MPVLSAVPLPPEVTAESSDAVSPVATEQLQKCRLLSDCHVLFALSEQNAGTGGKNLGHRLPLACSSWLPVPEEP